uniref:LRAT domain-containing protein n=1 Tax=Branchiostoma floridae TaxID=7739 RepID=C3YTB7_BRAFL|eukprot:XP_002600472.1 hypothetical protein BRAFLDRAFT_70153 [Branchiostoma floridae]
MVIHRTEDNGKVKVREDWFWDVVEDNLVRISDNIVFDTVPGPLPREEIVERARSKLGEGDYSTLFENCEHFAYWCRYNVVFSRQALTAAGASAGLIAAGAVTGNPVVAGLGVGVGAVTVLSSSGSKKSL